MIWRLIYTRNKKKYMKKEERFWPNRQNKCWQCVFSYISPGSVLNFVLSQCVDALVSQNWTCLFIAIFYFMMWHPFSTKTTLLGLGKILCFGLKYLVRSPQTQVWMSQMFSLLHLKEQLLLSKQTVSWRTSTEQKSCFFVLVKDLEILKKLLSPTENTAPERLVSSLTFNSVTLWHHTASPCHTFTP